RFEREGDIGVTLRAIERACRLIEEIGAGRVRPLYAEKMAKDTLKRNVKTVTLRVKQTNRVMGTHLSAGEIVALLERLELESKVSGDTVQISVPTFRRDIKEEIDLVEEVARVYGYDNIGLEETARYNVFSKASYDDRRNEKICAYLASRGFAEIITSSFGDPADPVRFGWRENEPRSKPIRIANPLTSNQSLLRTSLLPGMLKVVKRNSPAEQDGIKIFEVGRIFIPVNDGEGLPLEELRLAAIFARKACPLQWIEQKRSFDFFDMKGELEALFDRFGLGSSVRMVSENDEAPGLTFNWLIGDNILAEGGVISRRVADQYDIDSPVFYFDIIMDALSTAQMSSTRFSRISPYPSIKRDLCVVAGGEVTFSDIRGVISRQVKNLESIKLFDYFTGGNMGEGMRSYTFRLSFRSSKRTLKDSVIDKEIEMVLGNLQRELRVSLRME
ncbi:MAG: phenylalanine--tRNA ligase subunit beta, partial [Candidatus Krumholzibacteria bacterium]|nr:phenylalanine--tRNA ligase subunit beta [Candidatus Krumholzibacteria bacterium]